MIRYTGWTRVDPIIAVAIAFWVLPRTWSLMRESINVLLEGVPVSVKLDDIERSMQSSKGVANVHDLHVWEIGSKKISLSAHLLLAPEANLESVRIAVGELLREQFDIDHSTLQCELTPCDAHDGCAIVEETGHESHDHGPHESEHTGLKH